MGLGAGLCLLAVVETANALIAPGRAPSEADWRAAGVTVRAGFQPGDLIVAAPAWADPVMRWTLGDLVPPPVAGRMDAARFGRVWELSQRGAESPERAGATLLESSRAGRLAVRLWRKPAATVTFDFVPEWRQASLAVVRSDGAESPCALVADGFQCPGTTLRSELVEIDTRMRHALSVAPLAGVTLALTYPAVRLGRELAVAAGLHNVWLRKSGDGKVRLRVLASGRELGALVATSASGWEVRRFDTAGLAGQTATVRFEISVDHAHARHLGFAAEARDP